MDTDDLPILNTPEGLHYECTGCGKCCSGWSVPLTEEDYKRVVDIDWGSLSPDLKDKKLFRPLPPALKKGTPYSYAIIANSEGQCPFLKNNLCFIHSQFGSQTKPAMCQLFPYSFNETPGGIYASVSFVSRGAIFNAGKALSEQTEYLQTKYKDFKRLFHGHKPNWSEIKLSPNVPLTWPEYLEIEKTLILYIQDQSKSLESRFIDGSRYLNSLLNKGTASVNPETNSTNKKQLDKPQSEQSLNYWDKVLLSTLYKTYFPPQANRPQGYGQLIISLSPFLKEALGVIFAGTSEQPIDKSPPTDKPSSTSGISAADFYYYPQEFSYKSACHLVSSAWPADDLESNDMIYRFFYSHIFAKLYFGGGFGQLSLIAGFHQLALFLVLIKLHARALAMTHLDSKISQIDIIQTIVQLEKSLGEVKVSAYGAAILELLLASPSRVARLLQFAA